MNIIIDRTWKQGSLVNIEDLRGLTFQAEAQAHTFRISGVDAAGNPITLTGTPSGVMLRPDNTDVALTCAVSDGKVTATLPAECYDVPGRVGITIYLTSSNSQKVCIYSAITSVNRTSSGTASPGTTSSVVDLVNAIEAAIAQIPASDTNLKGALAPTYSDSAVYAVGQYAWYDGKLYKCTTAITTSESWTSGHWAEAKLAQDVCDLKSAMSNTNDMTDMALLFTTTNNKGISWSTGDLVNGNEFSYTPYVDVSGRKYIKYARMVRASSSSSVGVCFYDENKDPIPGSGQRTYIGDPATLSYYVDTIIPVPSNAKYARFTVNQSHKDLFYVKSVSILKKTVSEADNAIKCINNMEDELVAIPNIYNDKGIIYNDGSTTDGSNSEFSYTEFVDVTGCKYIKYARMVRASSASSVGMSFYDSNQNFIQDSGQQVFIGETSEYSYYVDTIIPVPTTAKYARFTLNQSHKDLFYVKAVSVLKNKITDLEKSTEESEENIVKLQNKSYSLSGIVPMRNIAYSLVGIAPINTLEHYLSVGKLGFNCIKGDVRITSDSKLVMCHDAGFTLSSSGRITTYSSSNNTPIRQMTEAQVLALEHSTYRDSLGYYAHPCTFEDYVKACKTAGLPPFVTLRDEYMDEIVPLVFSTLRKYRLDTFSIINSFTKDTLLACRAEDPYVKVSWVQSGDTPFTNELIDQAAEIGNCILSLQQTDFTGYETQMAYAISKGVEVYTAILYSYEAYQQSLNAGATGCQIARMIMTYSPTLYAFKLTVASGVISFGDYLNDGNLNRSRYTATITDRISESNSIYVSNICENGTGRSFPDGIMPTWLNTMPYKLTAKETHGYECSIRWAHQTNVNRLVVACEHLSTDDCEFEITVEV